MEGEVLTLQSSDMDDVLGVGDRVMWPRDCGSEYGTVRWIGVLTGEAGGEIHAGVEFDNPVGKGTGKFKDQRLFYTQFGHAALVPLMGLVKVNQSALESKQCTKDIHHQQLAPKPSEWQRNKIKQLTCSICQELFRSPRFLPCHHTFCLECLEKLAAGHRDKFPCPTCRTIVPSQGLSGLQVNFYLEEDLVEARKTEGMEGFTGLTVSGQAEVHAECQEHKQRLIQQVRQLKEELKEKKRLSKTIEKLQLEAAQFVQRSKEQKSRMADVRQENHLLRQQVRGLESDREQLETRLGGCQQQREKLQGTVDQLRGKLNSQLDERNKRLQEEIQKLKSEIQTYPKDSTRLLDTIKRLEKDKTDREKLLRSCRQRESLLEKEVGELRMRLNTRSSDREILSALPASRPIQSLTSRQIGEMFDDLPQEQLRQVMFRQGFIKLCDFIFIMCVFVLLVASFFVNTERLQILVCCVLAIAGVWKWKKFRENGFVCIFFFHVLGRIRRPYYYY